MACCLQEKAAVLLQDAVLFLQYHRVLLSTNLDCEDNQLAVLSIINIINIIVIIILLILSY